MGAQAPIAPMLPTPLFTTLVYSWLVKVSTSVHLNRLYIAVLTPGAMVHTHSNWAWRLIG